MRNIAPVVALAGSLMAAVAMSTLALAAAERQCGTVSAVGLSDPISGGTVSIDGRNFRVAGLGRNVHLPPVADLRVGVAACVEGDFAGRSDGSVDVTNGAVALLRDARAGDKVLICGTLWSFAAPTATNNEGTATLADEIWFLSGTPGPNNLSPQATARSNVCLDGQIAVSQTTRNLLIRWNLVPNPAQSPLPTPVTTPAATATATTATATVAAATAPSATLPATPAPQTIDSTQLAVGAALAVIALAALLAARALIRRRGA